MSTTRRRSSFPSAITGTRATPANGSPEPSAQARSSRRRMVNVVEREDGAPTRARAKIGRKARSTRRFASAAVPRPATTMSMATRTPWPAGRP